MEKTSKIAILGFGIEGRAIAKYLHKHGYENLTICDERQEIKDLPEHANVQLGKAAFFGLPNFDIIFRSPGIALHRPELQSAHSAGTTFTSVTKFFFEKCPCPIIGVSGTKGKGTTTALTHQILKTAGKDVHIGGNIGEAPTDFLDDLTPESLVVLELSSFQLEDLDKSPHISIVLNITRDHLDYHKNVKEYRAAKQALLAHQTEEDIAIINQDYEGSRAFGELGQGKKHWYSRQGESSKADAYVSSPDGAKPDSTNSADLMVLGEKIATTQDVRLRGTHNHENVLPACLAAKLLGVANETILKTLHEFQGLPHRLELVAEQNGVQYFNDSFSTTPETSMAAIRSFDEPLFLLAGGSEKHSDFTAWAKACATSTNLKKVLLMGATARRMEAALQDEHAALAAPTIKRKIPLDIVRVKNLQDAFTYLSSQTKSGDIVLLSPACASFGLFVNYKERGRIFRELAEGA
jgi:UDP-N-acetylmuramoylalanine--D-glutamate ligase